MDAKTAIGQAIRTLRTTANLSQEQVAEKAGITYQYLSAVENGKENFTVGILESLAAALGSKVDALVATAYHLNKSLPRVKKDGFIKDAPLPPGLTVEDVEAALNETHKIMRLVNATLISVAGRPLPAFIQRNNLSGIVSNVLCDAFSRLTRYKHNHHQRYPDLIYAHKTNGDIGLEVKSTIQVGKGGESHNGHSGWHVIACFALTEDSGDILFIHVMFAKLIGHGKPDSDWKYLKSEVNVETGSQRTETYMTTPTGLAKLRHGSIYLDKDVIDISRWRTLHVSEAHDLSPFLKKQLAAGKKTRRGKTESRPANEYPTDKE
jgi:transcriptional regulator with XRE-family HTH domain